MNSMSKALFFCLVSAFALSLPAAAVAPPPPPALFIFGDSLSDNGNAYHTGAFPQLVPPDYTVGKYTDGPDTTPASKIKGLWIEQLAPLLKLPPVTLYTAGGGNYAYAGAVTGMTAVPQTVPGLENQVAFFLQRYANQAPATSTYVIWGGSNDLLNVKTTGALLPAESTAIKNLKTIIGDLAKAGAKKFLWVNLPPLGVTPSVMAAGEGFPAAFQTASLKFKTDMTAAIPTLIKAYPGITITPVDVYSLLVALIDSPSTYALTNVTTPAQGLAVNPDKYLFWDGVHPTTSADKIVASLAFADLTKKAQSITFTVPNHLKTDKPFLLAAAATSKLAITYHFISGPAKLKGSTVTLTGVAGTVVIEATQPGNATYAPASEVTATFTVK